jgi:3-hydroxyisobutyrate dehydrogenase
MRVAILGTGTMGAGMARTLLRDGFDVTVWNRSAEKARPLADDGAIVAETSADAVAEADVVLTMLFDEAAVLEVAGDFAAAIPPGAVWMQSATVGPAGARRIADFAARHDIAVVDSPMVGTKQPAEAGELVVLVSGDPALVERIRPVLNSIGAKTAVVSEAIGDASSLKLACNAWVAAITAAAAQSLAICRALGVDGAEFLQAIDGTASNAPYLQAKGGLMLSGDFRPSFATAGLLKDLDLMIDAMPEGGSPLLPPLRNLYARTEDSGHASDDVAAVSTVFG